MNDIDLEKRIRQAGYDIQWEPVPGSDAKTVCAFREGKQHTRPQPTLMALAEHLGCVDRPVEFVQDRDALETVITKHATETNSFTVRRDACRVAIFNRKKFIQLVSTTGDERAMYELRTDGLRRTSKGNLPLEVVTAFAGRLPLTLIAGE
jgi:hypothetical protein